MSKAEEIAKAIYIRCFDDTFKYPDVLNALRICAEENAETIEQLQAQIEKMKCCYNCKHSRTEYEHCKTDKSEKWELKEK